MNKYIVALEYYSNQKAIIRSIWVDDKKYGRKSTVYAFFCTDLEKPRDIEFTYDKAKKFDGCSPGFHKFVIFDSFDKLNDAQKCFEKRITMVPLKHRELNDSNKFSKSANKNGKPKNAKKMNENQFPAYKQKQIELLKRTVGL